MGSGAADGEGSAGRLADLLREQGLSLDVEVGALDRGVILTRIKVAVLDTRLKIGFAVLGALLASPRIGGPNPDELVAVVFSFLF